MDSRLLLVFVSNLILVNRCLISHRKMLTKNLIVLLLNIYLVTCAPAENQNDLYVGSSSDQIAQDSNISGVSWWEVIIF